MIDQVFYGPKKKHSKNQNPIIIDNGLYLIIIRSSTKIF